MYLTIVINGTVLEEYEGVQIKNQIQSLGGTVSIEGAFGSGLRIKCGDIVDIKHNAFPVFFGVVVRTEREISQSGGNSKSIYCVDFLGLLDDCQLPNYRTYQRMSVVNIFKNITNHIKNKDWFDCIEPKPTVVERFETNASESVAVTCGRLAFYTDNYVFARGNGKILFTKTNAVGVVHHRVHIGRDDITNIRHIENIQGCADEIHGFPHSALNIKNRFRYLVKVPKYPRNLTTPNYLIGGDTQEEVRRMCNLRKREIMNDMISLEIDIAVVATTASATGGGKIFELNDNVVVADSTGKYGELGGVYCIKAFEISQSKAKGLNTKLILGGLV